MRALLICALLGCGGGQAPPASTTPPPAQPAQPAQPAAAGSGSGSAATAAALDAVIDKLGSYKDQMCSCPNTDCLEKINDDMNTWGKAQVKGLKDAPMTDAQTARLKTTMEEMQKCVKRISNMGG